jgi:hypothetical protein
MPCYLQTSTKFLCFWGLKVYLVRGQQLMVIWLRRPHGAPSGVWTGHKNPQLSGSSFRTVVVFISAKYAPLWMDLKWDRNLILFSLSAITEKPLSCIKSRPVLDLRVPVASTNYICFPIMPVSRFFTMY